MIECMWASLVFLTEFWVFWKRPGSFYKIHMFKLQKISVLFDSLSFYVLLTYSLFTNAAKNLSCVVLKDRVNNE
jgi:hypothetical protein